MNTELNIYKRLKIQSWRRGMKEVDLILGGFIDQHMFLLTENEISIYEKLLAEDDQKIFKWVLTPDAVPKEYKKIINKIAKFASSTITKTVAQ